jgi:hypothetical protein
VVRNWPSWPCRQPRSTRSAGSWLEPTSDPDQCRWPERHGSTVPPNIRADRRQRSSLVESEGCAALLIAWAISTTGIPLFPAPAKERETEVLSAPTSDQRHRRASPPTRLSRSARSPGRTPTRSVTLPFPQRAAHHVHVTAVGEFTPTLIGIHCDRTRPPSDTGVGHGSRRHASGSLPPLGITSAADGAVTIEPELHTGTRRPAAGAAPPTLNRTARGRDPDRSPPGIAGLILASIRSKPVSREPCRTGPRIASRHAGARRARRQFTKAEDGPGRLLPKATGALSIRQAADVGGQSAIPGAGPCTGRRSRDNQSR